MRRSTIVGALSRAAMLLVLVAGMMLPAALPVQARSAPAPAGSATPSGHTQTACGDLFFSEYVEGSSNNKALEIYNPTAGAKSLSGYYVDVYYNGQSTPTSFALTASGSVAAGGVWLFCHASASFAASCNQTSSAGLWNGDDAITLRYGTSTIVDSIGQVGFDPGTEWGTGLVSTADNTLRRKAAVQEGDTNPGNDFLPELAAQWDGYAQDTFDGLGSHTMNSCAADDAPYVTTTDPENGATGVPAGANVSMTFSENVNVDSGWYNITCLSSGTHTASVTGGPQTFTLDPETDFAPAETCMVTVYATLVHDQDAMDPPDTMEADASWSFEVAVADSAPSVTSTDPVGGAAGVATDADISVTFSEDVTLDADWFDITCTVSGGHSATVSGGPLTFVLDPDADLGESENCTVTVYATAVHDQDGNDPPDGLDANYPWTFETAGPIPPIIINELDSDTVGTDALEFIELYDGGAGNTALDGLVVVFYNGNNDLSYYAADLDTYSTDANGYFVLGNTAVSGVDLVFAGNLLQNGQDAAALYAGNAADFPTNTPVSTANLVDAIVYDTSDPDDPGLLVLLNAGEPQVDESSRGDSAGDSNQRCPNGSGGARNTTSYVQATPTPDGTNNCYVQPPEACGDPYTPIYDIQGSGLSSPLVGTEVALEGVVVGDFQNNGQPDNGDLNGFHVQDPTGDTNAATSDGVFVYYTANTTDVHVGDAVRVRGTVSEYYGKTEVSASQLWVCSTGNPLPSAAPVYLPVASLDDFEPFEGMLVTLPQALYIGEYFDFDRSGEIVLTSERQNTPTAVFEPGSPEQAALAQANLLGRITLDDGRSAQNPDPAIHPNGAVFDMNNLFRGGDSVANVTGVIDYGFDLYRIQPVQGADYTPVNLRPATPEDVGGRLKVVSFNLLNYFTTIDEGDGHWICGPAGDQECRGADTPEEFTRQRDKIISALVGMSPDVAGLVELENNVTDAPIADLVSGLNDVLGAGTYAYIATGAIGSDAIRVAIIYKPASVTPVGAFAVLDSTVDSRFLDTKNRPALAQSFQENATGAVFAVAVNHLKSKGSACDDVGDPDLGDGAGNCNQTRKHAAEALVDWLAADPTGSGDPDVLILGDLNSYDKEDPIDVLLGGGYTDLEGYLHGEYAYSYVFDGQVGYLDYALPNADLIGQVTGATIWHINSDEPDLIDYDMDFKAPAQDALYAPDAYRSGDHDPLVVGLSLCAGVSGADFGWDPASPSVGQTVTFSGSASGTGPIDYLWDFGDGSGAAGPIVEHSYAAPGTYLVTLTASNGCGEEQSVKAVQVAPLGTMHVQWIRLRYVDRCLGRYVLRGQVRVVDSTGSPVSGATLQIEWTAPDGTPSAQSSLTNPRGVGKYNLRTTQAGTWQLCVTDVVLAGWAYAPDQNQMTCQGIVILTHKGR